MKHLFTTLLLSIMSICMSMADSNISYSWESPSGTPIEAGGTATYENGDGTSRVNYPFDFNTKDNAKYYTLSIKGKYASINGTASEEAGYINIALQKPLKAGDTISVTGFISSKSEATTSLTLVYGNDYAQADKSSFTNIYFDDQDPSKDYGSDGFNPNTNKIIVPASAAGSTSIKLTRGDGEATLYITKLTISNEIITPKLTGITPANNSLVERFLSGDKLYFNTNFDSSCGGFKVSIIDNKKQSEIYSDFTSTKDTNGWILTFYNNVELMKDHNFTVKLEGHAESSEKSDIVNTVYAKYVGNGAAYQYSNTVINNVNPTNGSEIKVLTNNKIQIVFSGKSSVDKNKSIIISQNNDSIKFDDIKAVNDKTYEFTIPTALLAQTTSEIKLNIYATDSVGNVIKGDTGEEENSYTILTYKSNLGAPDFTTSPAEGNVESLNTFEFSYTGGISNGESQNPIILYASDKNTHVEDINNITADGTALKANLATAITTAGTYYLFVPSSRFKFADKYNNKETWIKYIVTGPKTDYHVTMTPADNTTVESLSTFTIAFNDWTNAIPYGTSIEPQLEDLNGNVISQAKCSFVHDNVCSITLSNTVKKAGTYILRIPAKCFVLGDWGNDLSEAMYFTYTVVPGPNPGDKITVTPADKSVVSSLSSITLRFENIGYSDVAVIADTPTLVDSEGSIVTKGKARWGNSNKEIVIDLEKEITTNGTYTLKIPANLFILDKEIYDKALSYTFEVSNTSGITSVTSDKELITIYNLKGELIRKGNAKEVTEGLNGIYIVNGKKILFKNK